MATYTASFDYEGTAPVKSFMETLITVHAGFTKVKSVSVVTWEITTTQNTATVENALETAIENHGSYKGGKIISVTVTG